MKKKQLEEIHKEARATAQVYIHVYAMPGAKKEKVVRKGDSFTIAVREPAERNLANKRIRDIVASELDIPPGKARLTKGHRSSKKMFVISR